MNYKNHLIFGTASSVATPVIMNIIGFGLNTKETVIIMASCLAGSLFPDCDTQSIPSRIYATLGAVLSVLCYFAGMSGFVWLIWIPFILAKMSKHRGWTHSKWLPIGLTLAPYLLSALSIIFELFQYYGSLAFNYRYIFIAFSIGLITHILLDTRWFKRFAIKIGIHKKNK